MALYSVPVLILKEGTQRTVGRDALRANIMAARALAEVLKTSLGPRGLDKMLVDSFGDITVTNDGATIVKEMEVQHPAAKLLVEVAKAQDAEVGDGTTSAVVFAGTLLEKAEELLEQNIHPTVIIEGYTKAMKEALKILEEIAVKVDPIASCSLPPIFDAYSLSLRASSTSTAPPPGRILGTFITFLSTFNASFKLLSTSSKIMSFAPRTRIVTALGFLQPSTNTILSLPTLLSSTSSAYPRSSGFKSLTLLTILPPVALSSFSMSLLFTLLTARMPFFARKCCATSSIPF